MAWILATVSPKLKSDSDSEAAVVHVYNLIMTLQFVCVRLLYHLKSNLILTVVVQCH